MLGKVTVARKELVVGDQDHLERQSSLVASDRTKTIEPLSQPERLLIDAKEAARLLSLSKSTLYSCLSAGMLPKPVRLGRSVRWSLEELRDWVRAGCPPNERWERSKRDAK